MNLLNKKYLKNVKLFDIISIFYRIPIVLSLMLAAGRKEIYTETMSPPFHGISWIHGRRQELDVMTNQEISMPRLA